jgi:hypothetical protein
MMYDEDASPMTIAEEKDYFRKMTKARSESSPKE